MVRKPRDSFVVKKIEIVSVCAWCTDETYPVLDDYQVYSHGICALHLRRMRHQARELQSSP